MTNMLKSHDRQQHGDSSALAPVIAVVGSDGAGKSTVCTALYEWLAESRPTTMHHLGKQTGDFRRKVVAVPLVGPLLGRSLKSGGRKVNRSKGADAISAIVTYQVSMRRLRRFRRMLALRRSGVTVIADRYPQLGVPGPKMDGPHLVVPDPRNLITRLLTQREYAHYQWMADHVPDLVIRLNVDLATAAARKPDHSYRGLERKIELTPQLTFNGAPIMDIDSTQPLDQVLKLAKRSVAEALARRAAQESDTGLAA